MEHSMYPLHASGRGGRGGKDGRGGSYTPPRNGKIENRKCVVGGRSMNSSGTCEMRETHSASFADHMDLSNRSHL